MKLDAKGIAYNGFIATLYVVLTLITFPISFLGIQFRLAEILILLCFFRKDYIFGLTLGCIIANLFSSIGVVDVLFGGVATLLSCLAIIFCKHLAIAILFPIALNSLIVGLELFLFLKEPFWISSGTVALGEIAVLLFGYVFVMIFRKNKYFFELIRANQNMSFKF